MIDTWTSSNAICVCDAMVPTHYIADWYSIVCYMLDNISILYQSAICYGMLFEQVPTLSYLHRTRSNWIIISSLLFVLMSKKHCCYAQALCDSELPAFWLPAGRVDPGVIFQLTVSPILLNFSSLLLLWVFIIMCLLCKFLVLLKVKHSSKLQCGKRKVLILLWKFVKIIYVMIYFCFQFCFVSVVYFILFLSILLLEYLLSAMCCKCLSC